MKTPSPNKLIATRSFRPLLEIAKTRMAQRLNHTKNVLPYQQEYTTHTNTGDCATTACKKQNAPSRRTRIANRRRELRFNHTLHAEISKTSTNICRTQQNAASHPNRTHMEAHGITCTHNAPWAQNNRAPWPMRNKTPKCAKFRCSTCNNTTRSPTNMRKPNNKQTNKWQFHQQHKRHKPNKISIHANPKLQQPRLANNWIPANTRNHANVQKFWRVFRMWKFVGMHNLWWCQENDISPFDHHNQTWNCPQSPTNHTLAVKLGHCHNVITGSMNQILDLQISLKLPHGDHQKMLPARDKVYKTIRSTTTLHHVPLRPLKTAIQNLTFPLLSGDVVRSNSMLDASKPHLPENRSKNEDAISGLEKVFMLRDWTCPKREKWKKWHGTEQWKQEKLLNTKKSTVSAIWSSSSGLIVQCCPLLCNAKVPTASQCQ